MDIVSALGAEGLTCVVGAGGKKTTLYALAARLPRAVVTATVRIPIFDRHVAAVCITDDPAGAVRDATEWPLGVVPEQERDDRYRGYDPDTVAAIADAGVDAVLVKADGARNRLFKAPGEDEPRIPTVAETVVPVASARIVGKPLDGEHVHRVERVAALTGLDPGDPIRPVDVARVLGHERGGRKGAPPDATVVTLLNMVDDERRREAAEEIASALLERADGAPAVPRVVLARMIDDDPLVSVVEP